MIILAGMSDSYGEKRKYARRKLIYYLKVFNRDTGVQLGNLVDLTAAGMMLISEEPLPTKQDFKFKIELPQRIDGEEFVELEAHSMWSKNDINPVLFDSGFQFTNLSTKSRAVIQTLIDQISFEND